MNYRPTTEMQVPCAILDEKCLIGACIVDQRCIDRAIQVINADGSEFFDRDLGKLFKLLCTMRMVGDPVDYPTVKSLMSKANINVTPAALFEMVANQGANVEWHCQQIYDTALLRRYICTMESTLAEAYRDGANPHEIETLLSPIRQGQSKVRMVSIQSSAKAFLETLDTSSDEKSRRHTEFGMYRLDQATGGMCGGELVIVAARPGCGKTSLGMQVAMSAAKHGQVLFVSLEMSDKELVARHLAGEAGVDSRRLRSAKIEQYDLQKLVAAASSLVNVKLNVWAPHKATVAQISSIARLCGGDTRLIVVDYVGLVRPERHDIPRHEQVAQITRDLKSLSKEIDCPVMALCQLNRDGDDAPKLVHLRESGAIEQDADMVLLIHRQSDTDSKIIIAKNRNGRVGTIDVGWIADKTRFEDEKPVEFGRHDFGQYGAF